MPTPPVKPKTKPGPAPRNQQPRRRSPGKPQYKAVAYLTGRPSEDLSEFLCSDGTRMPVRQRAFMKKWINKPGVFTEDAVWTVYPGHRGLALAWRNASAEGKHPDFMSFTAKFSGILHGKLTLYVGRNIQDAGKPQYHFVNLVIPDGLVATSLENLPPRKWLHGHARRIGPDWVLVGWEVSKRPAKELPKS